MILPAIQSNVSHQGALAINATYPSGLIKDEVSTLTAVFNPMISKVKVRENELKQQVANLRITIEPDKMKNEVEKITDSDFFQDIQTRAGAYRRHRSTDE